LVVMAHGFSATRELRLDAYAERFCAAGLGGDRQRAEIEGAVVRS